MRAAPAFDLSFGPGRAERLVTAVLGGVVSATVATWLWSHVQAAAGLPGGAVWVIAGVAAAAAVPGLAIGWLCGPRTAGRLVWQQEGWSLQAAAAPVDGVLLPQLDLGSWMLLRFVPADGSAASWLCVARARVGTGWHPLRATLFAPAHAPTGVPAEGGLR